MVGWVLFRSLGTKVGLLFGALGSSCWVYACSYRDVELGTGDEGLCIYRRVHQCKSNTSSPQIVTIKICVLTVMPKLAT